MPLRPFTKNDYVTLWRSILPTSYTDPIETEGSGRGMDVPSALAAMSARLARAANVTTQALYLRPHSDQTEEIARGARKASGVVYVARSAPNLGELVVPVGTWLEAEQRGIAGEVVPLGRYAIKQALIVDEGDSEELE